MSVEMDDFIYLIEFKVDMPEEKAQPASGI